MISTHVLDTSIGLPAAGVRVTLDVRSGEHWTPLGSSATDGDGRVRDVAAGTAIKSGEYRLHFATGAYFTSRGVKAFHPSVTIEFEVSDAGQHYHVPLLLTPFGYSTYRGT